MYSIAPCHCVCHTVPSFQNKILFGSQLHQWGTLGVPDARISGMPYRIQLLFLNNPPFYNNPRYF